MKISKYIILLPLLIVLTTFYRVDVFAFQKDSLSVINPANEYTKKPEISAADLLSREELHRYMGYEELLPKYISLPYDVTMNTNVPGQPFIDISFLFLMSSTPFIIY